MDGQQQRGRSPSAPGRNFILGSSAAHHFQGNNESSGQALDPALLNDPSLLDNKSSGPGLATYDISTPYLESSSQGPPYSQRPNTNLAPNQILGSSYVPDDPNQNLSSSSQFPGQHQQQGNYSELSTSDAGNQFSPFQNDSGAQDQSFDAFLLDPSLQGNNEQAPNQSINPADLMTDMASAHHATPPPHLSRQQSSPIHQVSPGMLETRYRSSSQSRPNSLDPSSAAFTPNNHTDWTGMLQSSNFQNHRRTPSEHSDVSSSVAPSPFLANDGNIDGGEHQASPMLNAQQDGSLFPEGLGIEHFTLSEANQQSRISPAHSPLISPRQSPQRGLSPGGGGPFMFPPEGQQGPFGPASGQGIYTGQAQDQFPTLVSQDIDDMGQAGQMAPPEINIEFASSSQAFEPSKPLDDGNALSPPDRGRKARMRAKSDPYTGGSPISRPLGAGASSPRLGPTESRQRSLSPLDIVTGPVISGASSPSQKSSRRSSTSSIPNRDYILDLADPQRPGSNATDSKRVQKHPATFQCTLCPKRFTRAYNLRSHLRTHTDERPFVCTVCGKAFARQHDRKRHEGLHSGEKKFVCKGELQSGNSWGCGRRFARADALGRHFRSEAGRVCIRPLLDEEALERQRVWNEGQMMAQGQGQAQPPPMDFAGIDANGNYTLPQALLAQYPALATLSWDNMGPPGPDDDDISGRSNYDASSGGEYYDDEGEGSGYVSGPGTGYSSRQVGNWSGNGY